MANSERSGNAQAAKLQELTDKVTRIEITQTEVFQPSLKRIEIAVQTVLQHDYLTRQEAKDTYAPKDDIAFLKRLTYTLILAVVTEFVALLFSIFKGST